jgi:hypothetical protein
MELSTVVGVVGILVGFPQCIEGYQAIFRKVKTSSEGEMPTDNPRSNFLPACLLLGGILCVAFGGWAIGAHPFRPVVEQKQVFIDKPIPCPITEQKTGPATARGGHDAFAHSGSGGDTLTVTPPPASPPKNSH